jgi:hypothetical protein
MVADEDGDVDTGLVLAASPDSKHLALATEVVALCSARTGRPISYPGTADRPFAALCFSPDGRLLAGAGPDHAVRLWDVPTGKERCRLAGHRGTVRQLVFARDGKALLSASEDGTAVVWDVARALLLGPPVRAAGPSRKPELLWADLAAEAATAEAALEALAAQPAEAIRLARLHLSPVSAPPAGRLGKLLADLDDAQAAVRDQAQRELESLGELAERAVRDALARGGSADLQRRLRRILRPLENAPLSAVQLRQSRAVELLETVGTPAARKLLAELAKGAADARLTQDARSALQRLERLAP